MDFAAARVHMLESQIRTSKVTDESLLAAIGAVPRELFVPAALRARAYVDDDLEIAPGRYLTEPAVLAQLIQALAIAPRDAVLLVGAGSGYAAAILAQLAVRVVALEEAPELLAAAKSNLLQLGLRQVEVVSGKLAAGWAEGARYQAILIDGAVEILPPLLLEQLNEDGRLTAVRRRGGVGRAVLGTRQHGQVDFLELFDAAIPLLPGFAAPRVFAL